MDNFWKAACLVFIATILSLTIGKTEKDFSLLLTIMACWIVAVIALSYLESALKFLWELSTIGEMQDGILGILLKAVGITLVTEFAATICSDAGNGSLGKMMQLLGTAVTLYLSIPVFNSLLTLIREMLGEL